MMACWTSSSMTSMTNPRPRPAARAGLANPSAPAYLVYVRVCSPSGSTAGCRVAVLIAINTSHLFHQHK